MVLAKRTRVLVLAVVVAIIGTAIGVVRAVVPSADERLVSQGDEAFESMRLNAYWAWIAVKNLGHQAPQDWSQLPKAWPTDPWGTKFQMVIVEQPVRDVPAEVTRGYEFDVPPESSGWFITARSAGPDTTFGTADDLLYWRANSSDDGMMIGWGNNFEALAWPASFDPY